MLRHSFSALSLSEQIRSALPIARRLLVEGIDSPSRSEEAIVNHVAALLDDEAFSKQLENADENAHARLWTALEAAQALGIALGMMLRAEAFLEAGGGR